MSSPEPVFVRPEQLSAAALRGLVEQFVLRHGTDYGAVEVGHEVKVAQVLAQVQRGEVRIAFDVEGDTCTLLRRDGC